MWQFNMQDYIDASDSSNSKTTCNKTNFEDEKNDNFLDQSIMVDPRKTAGYKLELDNYEVED